MALIADVATRPLTSPVALEGRGPHKSCRGRRQWGLLRVCLPPGLPNWVSEEQWGPARSAGAGGSGRAWQSTEKPEQKGCQAESRPQGTHARPECSPGVYVLLCAHLCVLTLLICTVSLEKERIIALSPSVKTDPRQ